MLANTKDLYNLGKNKYNRVLAENDNSEPSISYNKYKKKKGQRQCNRKIETAIVKEQEKIRVAIKKKMKYGVDCKNNRFCNNGRRL